MAQRSWPGTVTALLVGIGLAVVSHSRVGPEPAPSSTCGTAGCIACVPNNCGQLRGSQILVDAQDTMEERCVDFDGVPPAHCAYVTVDHKVIWDLDPYELVGDCQIIDCARGAPTKKVCTHPWVKPPDS